MSNAAAMLAARRPMRPKPTMPNVSPSRSPTVTAPRSSHRPSRTNAVSVDSRLTAASRCANTPSATALVFEPGVMTTGMPRRAASATSTRSVPTPVRARTFSAGIRSSMAASTVNAARTIAASAVARSSSVGSTTNRWPLAKNGVARSGSIAPSATNVSALVDISHPAVIRDAVVPATGSSFCH